MTSTAAAPGLPALRSVISSDTAIAISVASAAAAADTRHTMNGRCFCPLCFYVSPNSSSAPDPSPTVITCPRCPSSSVNELETLPFPPHMWPTASPSPPPNSDDNSGSGVSYETSIDSESDDGGEDADEDEDDDDDLDDEYDSDFNFYQLTPASDSFVASLPIKIFSPNSITPLPSCSICMDDFELNPDASGNVNELPCGHFFHKDCITEWLGRTNTCPLCRYELPLDPSKEEGDTEGADRGEDEGDMYLLVNSVATRGASARRVLSANGGGTSATNFGAMLDVVRTTFMIVDA